MMNNMWDTVEAYAWASSFDYDNYVSVYKKTFPTGAPFKEDTYKAFCNVFQSIMLKDKDFIPDAD